MCRFKTHDFLYFFLAFGWYYHTSVALYLIRAYYKYTCAVNIQYTHKKALIYGYGCNTVCPCHKKALVYSPS